MSNGQAIPEKSPLKGASFTHPDRLYWPEAGITKAMLGEHWAQVWPLAAPHLTGRPLALVRCPDGIEGERFFQKHLWKGARRSILPVSDPADPTAKPFLGIEGLEGLFGLVQAGTLEIHPWGSTFADWEAPDRIVMDLDPGEGVPWARTLAAARETGERLRRAGLCPFVKTSGGKGLHVVAPLMPKARWREAKAFAKGVADAMAADSPEHYVATIAKAKRGGKILIDYLRNQRGATAVAPYSPRAWPGAPVSMPITWDELDDVTGAGYFTMENTPLRLAAAKDAWADFADAAVPLERGKRAAGRA